MKPVQGVVPSGDREGRHRTAMPLRVGSRMVGVVCSSVRGARGRRRPSAA